MLEVRNVSKRFGGLTALEGCSFRVEAGQIFGVVGPNGSGKTTLFHIIGGLLAPDGGDIVLRDRSVRGWRGHRLAQFGVGRTFQVSRVFGKLTCRQNIEITWTLFRNRRPKPVDFYLDFFGLAELGDVLAKDLSHGQQKLLEFATVSAMEPQLLLLDEPTAGIHPALIGRIQELIAALRAQGRTVLIIEHTLRVVDALCDVVLVLDQGTQVAVGSPAELKAIPRVRQAYYLV